MAKEYVEKEAEERAKPLPKSIDDPPVKTHTRGKTIREIQEEHDRMEKEAELEAEDEDEAPDLEDVNMAEELEKKKKEKQ